MPNWEVPPPPPSTGGSLALAQPQKQELNFDDLIPDKNKADNESRVPANSELNFDDLIPAKTTDKTPAKEVQQEKLTPPPVPTGQPEKKATKTLKKDEKLAPLVTKKTPEAKLVAPPAAVPVNEDYVKTLGNAGKQALDTVLHQGRAVWKDVKKNPLEAAGAAIASAPAGPMKLGEDLGALLNHAIAGNKQAIQVANMLGINPTAHSDGNEAAKMYIASLPKEVQDIIAKNPGASGLGELIGQGALPLPGMASAGGKVAQIAKGVLKGAAAGEGFGAVSAAADQAKKGKSLSVKGALKAGLPSAIVGGAIGSAHGVLSKGKPEVVPEKTEYQIAQEQLKNPYEHVTMPNGEKLSNIEVEKILNSPNTPEQVKNQVADAAEEVSRHKLAGTQPPQHNTQPKPEIKEHAEGDEPAKVQSDALHNIHNAENIDQLQKVYTDAYKAVGKSAAGNVQKDIKAMLDRAYNGKRDELALKGKSVAGQNPKAPTRDDIKWLLAQRQAPSPVPATTAAPVAAPSRPAPIEVPQNNPVSSPAGEESSRAPGRVPAAPIEAPKTTPQAILAEAPRAVSPETKKIEGAPKTAETTRYIAEKDDSKPGGYVTIRDTQTGDIVSSSKRSLEKAQKLADDYNSGKSKVGQGAGSARSSSSKALNTTGAEAFKYGQEVPTGLKPLAAEMAEARHVHDEAQSKLDAMSEAFQTKYGMTVEKGLRRGKLAPNEAEEAANESAKKLEITNSKKSKTSYSFNKETTPEQQAKDAKEVLEQNKLAGQAEKAYKAARDKFDKGAREDETAPRSMNIDHPKGPINARYVPTERDFTQAPTEEYVKRKINDIKALAKHFAASESGSGNVGFGADIATLGGASRIARKFGISPEDAALAEGEKKIPGWKNNSEKLTKFFTLKRTLDFAKDVDPELHNELWRNISRETINSRGIKFKPDDDALVHQSLSMDPRSIRQGKEGLSGLTYEQRNYLAERRQIRQESAAMVRGALEKIDEEFGDKTNMPEHIKTRYEVLGQLENSLRGRSLRGDTSEASTLGDVLSSAMYDYVFKWNPAYHGLNLTDPLAIGGARAGLGRVMKAKYMLQTDKTVKGWMDGFDTKSPINQMKAETRAQLNSKPPQGVSDDWSYKSARAIAKLQSMLPDLPSEHWNIQDMMTAGFIKYGDEIGYKGGGMKFMHDLANGAIAPEEQVKAFTEALQVTNDVTGAGAMGLDKSIIQRVPALKYITQFVSQNYRVARLMRSWAKEGNIGAISTMLGIHTLLAGHAAIPVEVDILAQKNKQAAKLLYAAQDYLDSANVISHTPVIGRDLADKMRYSVFVPALGGAQGNIAYQQFRDLMASYEGHKLDKAGKALVYFALSSILGGGGLEAGRLERTGTAALKGKKEYSSYPDVAMPGTNDHAIGKHSRNYTPLDMVLDQLPGKNPQEAADQRADRRKNVLKKLK